MQINITKNKKISLIIILALSLILLIIGIVTSLAPADEENQKPNNNKGQYIQLNSQFTKNVDESYYSVKFEVESTGFYNFYIDGTNLYEISNKSLPNPTTNVYNNGTYYDYCYKIYLYADSTYTFTTNTNGYEYIKIIIKKD